MDFFTDGQFGTTALKLLIATGLSLVIGIERELKKKPVGLKTSIVIALFSCLLTIISIETAYNTPARNDINITMDPLRLAAQVVSGIGFLGAGVILRKGNDNITGLTTAAMIWGAAAIGIAVGAGFYKYAIATVLILVISIEVLAPFLIKVGPSRLRVTEASLNITLKDANKINDLLSYMKECEMYPEQVKIKDISDADHLILHEVRIRFNTNRNVETITLYSNFQKLDYIEGIEIELIK